MLGPWMVVGALALGACSNVTEPAHDGGNGGADASTEPPDAGPDPNDAGNAAPQGDSGVIDSGVIDSGVVDDAGTDGGACQSGGPLAIAGDYVAPDGTRHWLRRSMTATTYTVVPAGAPDPAAPPRLSRVQSVCDQWLLLAGTDGAIARLDWALDGASLSICVRAAANADAAAALPAASAGDPLKGCAGAAWTSLSKVAP
ncbi:Hypothetical protein A7982_08018 [Minicystis rosea]|nr:Hypothetical protein A7982_08018 [Minicystis rosea]